MIHSRLGSMACNSRSMISGLLLAVKPNRRLMRLTCVSTTTPLAMSLDEPYLEADGP